MKKILIASLSIVVAFTVFALVALNKGGQTKTLYLLNWGEYIDPEAIEMFEKDTQIKVIYDEYETNEMMYPKVEAGAVLYDVVCPSDYMIKKMIDNDMLSEINWENIPNSKNIGSQYY